VPRGIRITHNLLPAADAPSVFPKRAGETANGVKIFTVGGKGLLASDVHVAWFGRWRCEWCREAYRLQSIGREWSMFLTLYQSTNCSSFLYIISAMFLSSFQVKIINVISIIKSNQTK